MKLNENAKVEGQALVSVLARVVESRNGADAYGMLRADYPNVNARYLRTHAMPENEQTSTQYARRNVAASWVKNP